MQKIISILFSPLLLLGCGGGSSSPTPTSIPTPSPTITPTPTPTSIPTPSPTITPTPTPTITPSPVIYVGNAPSQSSQATSDVQWNFSISSGTLSVTPTLLISSSESLQSLDQLPQAVSYFKQNHPNQSLRIHFEPGTYKLSTPWIWTSSSSGQINAPVVLDAQPNTVWFEGSETLVATSTASPQTSSFEQLWIDGQRATLARQPNRGHFYFVNAPQDAWNQNLLYNNIAADKQAFEADLNSLDWLAQLSASDKQNMSIVMMQSWTHSLHRLLNQDQQTLLVAPESQWSFLNFAGSQRYFFENVASALDEPGEWILNHQQISFIPWNASSSSTLDIPLLSQWMRIDGTSSQPVSYLSFKGLGFRYTGLNYRSQGLKDSQGAHLIGAAIEVNHARSITFEDNQFQHTAAHALWLKNNVQQSSILRNRFVDLGASGIRVGLTQGSVVSGQETQYNRIEDNIISSVGHEFPGGGMGIFVGKSAYNTIRNNVIDNTSYSGISVGWSWGYGASDAHHNTIDGNYLHRIFQGSLSDGAAIYTLGISPGTTVSNNRIDGVHGFNTYGSGVSGIYSDEGSSDIDIFDNWVQSTDNGAYFLHYGQNLSVHHNVFIGGYRQDFFVGRSESHLQATLHDNYFFPTRSDFIRYNQPNANIQYANNQVALPSWTSICPLGSGCYSNTALSFLSDDPWSDPQLLNQSQNVSWKSSATSLGKIQIPLSDWQALQNQPSPSLRWASTDAPTQKYLSIQSSTLPLGVVPKKLVVTPPQKTGDSLTGEGSIRIASDGSSSCLALKDGPSITNTWEPFIQYQSSYSTGSLSVSFDVKADANTYLIHEWRDSTSSPYLVGPQIRFIAGQGIQIKSTTIGTLPLNEYVHVELSADLNVQGLWNYLVRYANGTELRGTQVTPVSLSWKNAANFLWISNTRSSSTTCLDQMHIQSH